MGSLQVKRGNWAAKFEFIRLKTQTYGSVVFRRIYWEEGFHAFYTGFSPAMCGVMVYAGTSFFTYEALKDWAVRRRGSSMNTSPVPPSPVEKLGCGAVAGLLGQAASYPMDVVR